MHSIELIREFIRRIARAIARVLDAVSGGRLHPNTVTIIGLAMHVPIALAIATGHFVTAAILLVVFGLFDVLDGELARLQKRASAAGMVLDATTDRVKEVLLYAGIAYWFASAGESMLVVWTLLACGASLSVSYVKAKAETAVALEKRRLPHHVVNRLFGGGLLPFEARMAALVLALLIHQLAAVVVLIAVLGSGAVLQRLISVIRQLG